MAHRPARRALSVGADARRAGSSGERGHVACFSAAHVPRSRSCGGDRGSPSRARSAARGGLDGPGVGWRCPCELARRDLRERALACVAAHPRFCWAIFTGTGPRSARARARPCRRASTPSTRRHSTRRHRRLGRQPRPPVSPPGSSSELPGGQFRTIGPGRAWSGSRGGQPLAGSGAAPRRGVANLPARLALAAAA
jgi:hypothetical protein